MSIKKQIAFWERESGMLRLEKLGTKEILKEKEVINVLMCLDFEQNLQKIVNSKGNHIKSCFFYSNCLLNDPK